jgi:hypothetical protein
VAATLDFSIPRKAYGVETPIFVQTSVPALLTGYALTPKAG